MLVEMRRILRQRLHEVETINRFYEESDPSKYWYWRWRVNYLRLICRKASYRLKQADLDAVKMPNGIRLPDAVSWLVTLRSSASWHAGQRVWRALGKALNLTECPSLHPQ